MEISLRQLEAFVHVVDNRSFSRAGEELFLSQSTISCHVAQLEKALQTTLLQRREKKNVEPTPEGLQVYRAAVQILHQTEALEGMFREQKDDHPLLAIAASTVPARYILPQLVAGYAATHPTCRFSVLGGDSSFSLDRLASGEAVFAFVGTKSRQTSFCYHPLCRDRIVLVTPNTPVFAQKRQSGALGRELLSEPLIMRESGSGTRRETDRYLAGLGMSSSDLHIAAYMNDIEAIKRMVVSGAGVSILSERAAEDEIRAGQLICFPLEQDGLYRELYLAYLKNHRFTPNERAFLSFAKKFGAQLNGDTPNA